jgi:hypothetical protein
MGVIGIPRKTLGPPKIVFNCIFTNKVLDFELFILQNIDFSQTNLCQFARQVDET